MKQKLIILTDWYLPAYKAGGPVKSVSNLTNLLCENYEISIFTSNIDKSEDNAELDVKKNQWLDKERYSIYYSSADSYYSRLKSAFRNVDADVFYLNSIFSFRYAILPLLLFRLKVLKRKKVVLAPRGMLHDGALSLKGNKKQWFLRYAKLFRLFKDVSFHATDDVEKQDIIRKLKKSSADIQVIPNVPSLEAELSKPYKKAELRIIFLARLSEKKNLKLALEVLAQTNPKNEIIFDLYGPIEENYYDSLKYIVADLPSHINLDYKGELNFNQTHSILSKYHVYFLPTQGENFGHSIYEAFAAGLPIVISDQTPWRHLEAQKVGFDIPLDDLKKFIEAIDFFATCSEEVWKQWSMNARRYAEDFYQSQDFIECYKKLFEEQKRV